MTHPMMADLQSLSETELENKIAKLNRTYFIASNEDVRHQIILVLDTLKLELEERRVKQKLEAQQPQENGESGLDNLINIS